MCFDDSHIGTSGTSVTAVRRGNSQCPPRRGHARLPGAEIAWPSLAGRAPPWPARFLALGVVALTIAKVFIIDTASIGGIYRALSVIGLGVVLLGIGWLYQRLLYPRAPAMAAPGPHD